MSEISTIYDRIRALREKRGLTQDELASKLGYTSRSSIAKIESGKTDITQSKVKEMALILNTTTSYLLDGETDLHSTSNNELSNEENKLLSDFRKLNNKGKEKVIERIEELIEMPKYTLHNDNKEI